MRHRQRETNQDFVLAEEILFAVADGMGQGGDIASTLALDTLREVFRADPTADGLLRAVHDANHVVWKHVTADPDRDDIGGTTLTAVAMLDESAGAPSSSASETHGSTDSATSTSSN